MYRVTVPSLNLTYYEEQLSYVKYQEKNNLMLTCHVDEAQGVISKDGSTIYKFNADDTLKEDYAVCTIEYVTTDERFTQVETKADDTKEQADELAVAIDSILTDVLPSMLGV